MTVINTPHTPEQIRLVEIIEAHSFEWYIDSVGELIMLVPWSRRKVDNTFESGSEEHNIYSIAQLREVLGY